jgi:hypothetical protein
MQRLVTTGVLIALLSCNNARPAAPAAIAAAELFTRQYARRKLRASVAGTDCKVLVIAIENGFDDGLVESIHYGASGYDALGGGEQFVKDRGFRAVVYRDGSGYLKTYGATTFDEARTMPRCR